MKKKATTSNTAKPRARKTAPTTADPVVTAAPAPPAWDVALEARR